MSNYIDLDSIWRDRIDYPNPANYQLTPGQVATWFKAARETRSSPPVPTTRSLEFVTSVHAEVLTLPYRAEMLDFPRVYMDFHCSSYDDKYLINSIDGRQASARFIFVLDKVQNGATGAPMWMHYKCTMDQVLRFRRDDPVVFRLLTRDGNVIPFYNDPDPLVPIDPTQQILATFTLTPYLKDAHYSNHSTETILI